MPFSRFHVRRSFVATVALCAVILGIALVGTADRAFAQADTATLSGTIVDPSNAVVPGVLVTIANQDTNVTATTKTTGAGVYHFSGLRPGTYLVSAEKGGFKKVSGTIVLNVQGTVSRDFTLEVGIASETIQVEGSTLPINTESAVVGTIVDRQFVENLPLNGRTFQSLIALTPGVITMPGSANGKQGQFSINGMRDDANSFSVDGVSANTGASLAGNGSLVGNNPGLTGLGTTQSLVSVDALQEFKVLTSNFSAENGTRPGGQIIMTTRSGTNSYHGNVFEYFRNDVLDANNWFANRAGVKRPPERNNDFGGTLGGPIVIPHLYNGRDRTFFFFSYEGLRLVQPSFYTGEVPTLTTRQTATPSIQSILNAFPLPNGNSTVPGWALFNDSTGNPQTLDATSVRVDHTFNSKLTVFGRYASTPSENGGRSLGNLSSLTLFNTVYTLGSTFVMTPHISNTVRVNFTQNNTFTSNYLDTHGGATPAPRSLFVPAALDPGEHVWSYYNFNFLSQGAQQIYLEDRDSSQQHQFNLVDSLSYSLGAHQLKFGVDYRRLTPLAANYIYNRSATFTSLANLMSGIVNNTNVQAHVQIHPLYTNFSAYAQDTWRATRRLTLDFGVRYELNPSPSEADGKLPLAIDQITNLATSNIAPPGTKEYNTALLNFAPRFGAAYQLRQGTGHETVLRGGIGIFYDVGNNAAGGNFGGSPYGSSVNLTNTPLPFTTAQVTPLPVPITLTAPYPNISAFDPNLQLPYTWQWNFAVEQALGRDQNLTVTYVGNAGRRLLLTETQNMAQVGNRNFTQLQIVRNRVTSDYDALQAQFRRRLSHGLQALVSYSWSHALDWDSTGGVGRQPRRGNANFDLRQVFSTAVTYDIPKPGNNAFANAVLGHWSVDTSFHAETPRPVDLSGGPILQDAVTGTIYNTRPNYIPGIDVYVDDATAPGGRRFNTAVPTNAQLTAAGCRLPGTAGFAAKGAFCVPLTVAQGNTLIGASGNLGRNQFRTPIGVWQQDFAVRREFPLRESLKLQFRAEAFNIFNHPNFANFQLNLTSATFGQAQSSVNNALGGVSPLFQIGGPRSFQFAAKLIF